MECQTVRDVVACVPLYSTSATASLKVNDMMLAILKLSKITWTDEMRTKDGAVSNHTKTREP